MKLNELLQLADSGRADSSRQARAHQPLPGEWKAFFLKPARRALPGADADALWQFFSSKAGQELSLTLADIDRLYCIAGRRKRACTSFPVSGQERTNQERFRSSSIKILDGTFDAAAPEDLPQLMRHLPDQILSSRFTLHPIELAAMSLKRLIDISPYEEKNEEAAVLLMDRILTGAGFVPIFITPENRAAFMNALCLSRRICDMEPLSRLTAEEILRQQRSLSSALLPPGQQQGQKLPSRRSSSSL